MTRRPRLYLVAPAIAIAFAIATIAAASPAGPSGSTTLAVNPSDFSTTIDNPLFPLSTLGPKVFEGEEVDPDTGEIITQRLESRVLPDTINVGGVDVLVLEEKAYANGELIEVALDYFAQASDGTVYYFGEDVDNYINGVIDNHDGTWHAGEAGAEPGIIMPAVPIVGLEFAQEIAPGVAEDRAMVVALDLTISTAAGDFTGCVEFDDWNPLEPPIVIENKFYCPGVGLVRVDAPDGFEDLTSYSIVDQGTPTPSPNPSPTASPTESPSESPTPSPTPAPTIAPLLTGTGTTTPTPAEPPARAAGESPAAVADDDDDEDDDDADDAEEDDGEDDSDDGEDDSDELPD
jgi:hypothetical protein